MKEFEDIRTRQELQKQVQSLTGALKRAKAATEGFYEAAREGARDGVVAAGKPKNVPAYKPSKVKGKPEVAVLHLSDWQLGKETASYDSQVAVRRVETIVDRTLEIVEIERSHHPVRQIHVLLGGDLIEGVSVFPGQQALVDSSLMLQVSTAAGALGNLLRRFAAAFDEVVVHEEDGNHGRIGKRGDFPKDNADNFTYSVARLHVQDLVDAKRLVWHEREGWYTIAEIGNYRALLVHGDEVKSFGGNTPAFGIARKVASWAAGVLPEFTDCYMGHWHQPLVIPLPQGHRRTFVNPSLESGNVYAQEFVGSTGSPGQRLNFVEPVKGRVTAERILWCDD
jgi:hypothetical protein